MKKLRDIEHPRGPGIPGLTSKLIKREGKVCLYERSDLCYEVFIVQVRPAENKFGKDYPEREVYPGNEDFGYTAWCYNTFERAAESFDAQVESQKYVKGNEVV